MLKGFIRVLGVVFVSVCSALNGIAQDPDNGIAASEINEVVEASIMDALRTTQFEQWELHQSRALGNAIVEHEFHSPIGVRLRRLTTQMSYMESTAEAKKRLDSFVVSTSAGGSPLSNLGNEAFIWKHRGYASVVFREGSVVARIEFQDFETVDDLGPIVIDFAEDVAIGMANGQ